MVKYSHGRERNDRNARNDRNRAGDFPAKIQAAAHTSSCAVLHRFRGNALFFRLASALVDWNFSTSVWIGVAGFLLVLLGVGFAVAGLCLHKKVKTAGIVLSVLAIVNPFALLGCCFGGLYTALAIFGM